MQKTQAGRMPGVLEELLGGQGWKGIFCKWGTAGQEGNRELGGLRPGRGWQRLSEI